MVPRGWLRTHFLLARRHQVVVCLWATFGLVVLLTKHLGQIRLLPHGIDLKWPKTCWQSWALSYCWFKFCMITATVATIGTKLWNRKVKKSVQLLCDVSYTATSATVTFRSHQKNVRECHSVKSRPPPRPNSNCHIQIHESLLGNCWKCQKSQNVILSFSAHMSRPSNSLSGNGWVVLVHRLRVQSRPVSQRSHLPFYFFFTPRTTL